MPASILQPLLNPEDDSTPSVSSRPERIPHPGRSLAQQPPIADPSLYFNRELSWLAFNDRVLNEAAASWPLLERLKFLAIFFSNLDEFFMIRVSALHQQVAAGDIDKSPDGLLPREQLMMIRAAVRAQTDRAAKLLAEDLLPQLDANNVRIHTWASLDSKSREAARQYFREMVFPVLTPLVVDPVHPFPFLSNLSLSLAIEVLDPETRVARFARVKVPEILPRFVPLEDLGESLETGSADIASKMSFVPMEDLIHANLRDLFPGMEILDCHPFRVTRDMDIEILKDEADDLVSVISRELRRRKFGAVVRLELTPDVPERVRQLLVEKLEINQDDVYEFPGPLGASSLFAIAELPRPDLRETALTPVQPPQFGQHTDIFSTIASGDHLIHLPYESFTPVQDLVRQASEDRGVLAIKMTLYRIGSNPDLIRSLITAAESGKQVAVCIEIKARFEEESNIAWAEALEHAGVHVFYGAQGLKTHAKVLLVVRREGGRIKRYVHMSTGNYNATTARIYTDLGLFTADPEIGEDVSELFNHLSGFSHQGKYRKLEAGPRTLVHRIIEKIEEQSELARAGKAARIFAKMNSLVDIDAITALYRASQAGVEVYLCVRGICCLRPGVSGVSENIRVFSVVGRFLEHNRVFIFGHEGKEEIYLSSADWMPRNFYNRVELMFPLTSQELRERIYRDIVAPLMTDNCRAYELGADGTYSRRTTLPGETRRDAQEIVMDFYAAKPLTGVDSPGS
jgi:polyphosphate kinase